MGAVSRKALSELQDQLGKVHHFRLVHHNDDAVHCQEVDEAAEDGILAAFN